MLYGCQEILHHFPQKQLVLGSSERALYSIDFAFTNVIKMSVRCGENF